MQGMNKGKYMLESAHDMVYDKTKELAEHRLTKMKELVRMAAASRGFSGSDADLGERLSGYRNEYGDHYYLDGSPLIRFLPINQCKSQLRHDDYGSYMLESEIAYQLLQGE